VEQPPKVRSEHEPSFIILDGIRMKKDYFYIFLFQLYL
jgi:hypothetical protein